jgi:uncharacterized protein YodC (DUF2158 family)
MDTPLPVGTIVWLKSGGPPMMVSSMPTVERDVVWVEWFNGGEVRRDTFDVANLQTEEPKYG